MNALEFVSDQYVSFFFTYYLKGWIFNRIPGLKWFKLREVISFSGFYGSLTDKNNPEKNGENLYLFPAGSGTLGKAPYMEASVGIENIFKFMRLDYVWRLNYRNRPDIQTSGVRCTMHITF